MSDFLAGNWGNVASVAGLVFSILAFVFSKRASVAAREARDATLLRSLSEEMNGANRTAGEIATYVGMERGDVALLRTSDLMNQTSYIMARWDNRLSEGSKNKMLTVREELVSINRVLTRGAVHDLSPKAKAKLSQACQQLNAIFSEEYGRAVMESERGVH
jgi:hypothetical protein